MARFLTGLTIGAVLALLVSALIQSWNNDGDTSFTQGSSSDAGAERSSADKLIDTPAELPRRNPATTLKSVLEKIPSLPPAATGRRLEGRVINLAGEPIAGARIEAHPPALERRQGRSDERSIEEQVRDLVQSKRRIATQTQNSLSDEDGRFVFESLSEGAWTFTGEAQGYRIASKDSWSNRVLLRAHPTIEVDVDVAYEDGSAPAKAQILIDTGNFRPESQVWTPRQGPLQVPLSALTLQAQLSGDDPALSAWKSERVLFNAERDESPQKITLTLKTQPMVYGRVDRSLRHRAGMVYATQAAPEGVKLSGRHLKHASVDRNDRYKFEDLSEGRWYVAYVIDRVPASDWHSLDVHGPVECDLEAEAIDPSRYLQVQVLDPTGLVLRSGLRFNRRIREDGSSSSSGVSGEFHRDTWLLPKPVASKGATCLLTAKGKFGTISTEFPLPQTEPVVLRYRASGRLRVRVDCPPKLMKRVVIGAISESRSASFDRQPDGSWLSQGELQPGRYTVICRLRGRKGQSWSTIPEIREKIELGVGEQECSLRIPPVYELRVRIPGIDGGHLTINGESGYERRLDMKSDTASREMHAGHYRLRYQSDGMLGQVDVDLYGNRDVTLVPQTINALLIEQLEPESPAAQAGLKAGDFILKVDGARIQGTESVLALHTKLMKGTRIQLVIARGGRMLEIAIDSPATFSFWTPGKTSPAHY